MDIQLQIIKQQEMVDLVVEEVVLVVDQEDQEILLQLLLLKEMMEGMCNPLLELEVAEVLQQ